MTEEDLRDCFAMFASVGWLMNGDYTKEEIPALSYEMADAMLEARKHNIEVNDEEDDGGITTVAPKRTRRKSR